MKGAAVGPQRDADFARQPVVLPAVASLALTQKYRHPHLELLSKPNDVLAVLLDRFSKRVGAGRSVANFRRAGGDGAGKSQRLRRIARHRRCRAVLLAHGRRYAAEERLENFDHLGDALHGIEAIRRVALQSADFQRDFFGGLLRLLRQLLHLGRDHGKAAAGLAGAGSFDRCVEREQIGLPRDGRDQIEHLTDLGR